MPSKRADRQRKSDRPTLRQLIEQRAALDARIEQLQQEQRTEAIAAVRALMYEHRLSFDDIASTVGEPVKTTEGRLIARYLDPATGETWSGRGLQPRWLKAALAEGRSLEEFVV